MISNNWIQISFYGKGKKQTQKYNMYNVHLRNDNDYDKKQKFHVSLEGEKHTRNLPMRILREEKQEEFRIRYVLFPIDQYDFKCTWDLRGWFPHSTSKAIFNNLSCLEGEIISSAKKKPTFHLKGSKNDMKCDVFEDNLSVKREQLIMEIATEHGTIPRDVVFRIILPYAQIQIDLIPIDY
jgi:hypothetical protein